MEFARFGTVRCFPLDSLQFVQKIGQKDSELTPDPPRLAAGPATAVCCAQGASSATNENLKLASMPRPLSPLDGPQPVGPLPVCADRPCRRRRADHRAGPRPALLPCGLQVQVQVKTTMPVAVESLARPGQNLESLVSPGPGPGVRRAKRSS